MKKLINSETSALRTFVSVAIVPIKRHTPPRRFTPSPNIFIAVGGEDNVLEVKIVKEGAFLHMAETGYGTERDNLDEPDAEDIQRNEADDEIARRLRDGESYRSIVKDLGVSPNRIAKVRNKMTNSNGD